MCCLISSNYQLIPSPLLFFLLYSLLVCSSITCLPNLELLNRQQNEQVQPVICNLRSLVYLDLSDNQFSGSIPPCLGNFSDSLSVLNLQKNKFNGTIPQTFGNSTTLRTLDISHNGLQGELPRSLENCTKLEVLNVGYNSIADVFPFWLENLPALKVLVLRNNRFRGPIGSPRNRSAFNNLHIIDVSHNDFTGPLPSKYFESWHAMMIADKDSSQSQSKYMGDGGSYYFDSVTIMNKGLEMVLVRILTIFKAVDFSYNKFNGTIPKSIGRLGDLHVLNFSGNGLGGPIPFSLGNIAQLESLDLSQNHLSGKIPQQLTNLTFLEVFDVSNNNLIGMIPRGSQFDTFSNTSYRNNSGLCGVPLSKNCGNFEGPPSSSSPSSSSSQFITDNFGWEAVMMGYGCGVVVGMVIGSCIIRRKEEWLARTFGIRMLSQQGKRSKKAR